MAPRTHRTERPHLHAIHVEDAESRVTVCKRHQHLPLVDPGIKETRPINPERDSAAPTARMPPRGRPPGGAVVT